MILAALRHIDARNMAPSALVALRPLTEEEHAQAVLTSGLVCIAQPGPLPESSPLFVGKSDGSDLPSNVLHVVFAGGWRAIPVPLKQRVLTIRPTTFLCWVAQEWRHPPTPRYILRAVRYRLMRTVIAPVVAFPRRAADITVALLAAAVTRALRPFLAGHNTTAANIYAAPRRRVGSAVGNFGNRLWDFRDAGVRIIRRLTSRDLESMVRRAAGKALPGTILAPVEPIEPAAVDWLLAQPGIAGVVLRSPVRSDLDVDARVGRWSDDGWALPHVACTAFVFGKWHRVPPRAISQAAEARLRAVYLAVGPVWLRVPRSAIMMAMTALRLWRRYVTRPGLPEFRAILADSAPPTGFVPGRVVIVSGNLAPGGAERQVANTLIGLQGCHLESVQLLCDFLTENHPNRYDFYRSSVAEAGIASREIERHYSEITPAADGLPASFVAGAHRLPGSLPTDIANLYREFRAIRPEVVHAFLDWSNVRAGIAALLAGVPRIVISGRNVNPSHFGLYQPYMDPAYATLLKSSRVVAVNNSVAGALDYCHWLGVNSRRISVLRNGVEFGQARRADPATIAEVRASLGVPAAGVLIGGIFRFSAEKRPVLWIEAAGRIAAALPLARFVLHGQGGLEAEMRAAAAVHGLADRLIFAGLTTNVLRAVSAMDVLLLCSFKEGTPNVVLEAQWVGTPVVATDAGGTREAVDEGRSGFIVDEPDAARIADQVLAVLSSPDRLSTARTAGPAFVEARFGMQRMIKETLAAYGLGEHPTGK